MQGGRGGGGDSPSTNSCAINDRASFLPVKSSTVNLVNVLHGVLLLSLEHSMMKSSTLFECGPLPPYIHLASTRCHSCDRCSQAFPVLCALPLLCIILNENQRTKKKTGNTWERRLSESWDDWLWQFVSNTYVYHRGSPCRQKQLPVIWTKVNIYASNHLHMYPPKTTSILVGSCFHLFESNFKPYTLTTLLFISLLVLRLFHQSCSKTN